MLRLSVFIQVADGWILVLQQVLILERVRSVGHLLVRFGSDFGPVVGGLVQHEEAMFLESFNRGS